MNIESSKYKNKGIRLYHEYLPDFKVFFSKFLGVTFSYLITRLDSGVIFAM